MNHTEVMKSLNLTFRKSYTFHMVQPITRWHLWELKCRFSVPRAVRANTSGENDYDRRCNFQPCRSLCDRSVLHLISLRSLRYCITKAGHISGIIPAATYCVRQMQSESAVNFKSPSWFLHRAPAQFPDTPWHMAWRKMEREGRRC